MYTDSAPEFKRALEDLDIENDQSTLHRHEANAVIERSVRKVRERTSSALVQSGFNDVWWPWAMSCYCFLKNVFDILGAKSATETALARKPETAWERRFGPKFHGSCGHSVAN